VLEVYVGHLAEIHLYLQAALCFLWETVGLVDNVSECLVSPMHQRNLCIIDQPHRNTRRADRAIKSNRYIYLYLHIRQETLSYTSYSFNEKDWLRYLVRLVGLNRPCSKGHKNRH
jgi:hypothetical protein